jgi:hypothetical protein
MALAALTLFGASTIHFGVVVPFGVATVRDPFAGAAIPEAILGVVLAAGAIIVLTGVASWPV